MNEKPPHNTESGKRELAADMLANSLSDFPLNVSLSPFWRPTYLELSAWVEHIPFAFWLTENLRPKTFVELGSHYGTSYFAFCQSVQRLGLATNCYAVDTWKGDQHAGTYDEKVFQQVKKYNEQQYSDFSRLIRSTFDEALKYFEDGSIDLLHIDGLHTLEAVRHDFNSWLPKLSSQAVVILHDTNVRERDFGVFKLFGELKQRYPHFEFVHGHGLGVLGVGPEQNDVLKSLYQVDNREDLYRNICEIFGRLGRGCADAMTLQLQNNQIKPLMLELDAQKRQTEDLKQQLEKSRSTVSAENMQLQESNRQLTSKIELLKQDHIQAGLLNALAGNKHIEDMCAERLEVELEFKNLKQQLVETLDENKKLNQKLIERFEETAHLTQVMLSANKELACLSKQYGATQKQLKEVYGSISWRITAPLRLLNLYRSAIHQASCRALYRLWGRTEQRLNDNESVDIGVRHPKLQGCLFQHYGFDKVKAKKKIAIIARNAQKGPTSSMFIRLFGPLSSIVILRHANIRLYPHNTIEVGDDISLCIVQRTAFDESVLAEKLCQHLASRRIKLIVDTDDAFSNLDKDHPQYELEKTRAEAFNVVTKGAHRIWASTEQLRNNNPLTAVLVRNGIDQRIWGSYKKTPVFTRGQVRMLYSGTATHDNDLDMIIGDLDRLNEKFPGEFQLSIIGVSKKVPDRSWIKVIEIPGGNMFYPEYVHWVKQLGVFDIGIAPLVNNQFNTAKSDIKILEYLSMGVLPVVSDLTPYADRAVDRFVIRVNYEKNSWLDALSDVFFNRNAYRALKETQHKKIEKYLQSRSTEKVARILLKEIKKFSR